jgi:hypothetical protein
VFPVTRLTLFFLAPTLIFIFGKKKRKLKIAANPDRSDFRFWNGLKI